MGKTNRFVREKNNTTRHINCLRKPNTIRYVHGFEKQVIAFDKKWGNKELKELELNETIGDIDDASAELSDSGLHCFCFIIIYACFDLFLCLHQKNKRNKNKNNYY